MSIESKPTDKASELYWTNFWKQLPFPGDIDVTQKKSSNYVYRKLDKHFEAVFSNTKTTNASLLEIGCGNSAYLTYFHRRFGFQVNGIDYSTYACERTREILHRDGISGQIHHADLFQPPPQLLNAFDVVCSFGVAEHFTDTTAAIRSMAAFVKPGGLLITTIPNLSGPSGWLQKAMYKPVYDIHQVMRLNDLSERVAAAGLQIVRADRFVPISFGITLEQMDNIPVKGLFFKRLMLKGLQTIEKVLSFIDDRIMPLPLTDTWCAGMVVTARKQAE
jgi:SAM-dependent methyltransferase